MLPPPAITTLRTGSSSLRISRSTVRMSLRAAIKNTSSPSSTTVSPSGVMALPPRIDRDDAALDVRDVLRQLAQRMADERAAAARAHADEPHAAVGEIEHLQRAGVADQALDVIGHERLGADRDVDRDAVRPEQLLAARELARADARDASRRAEQRERDLAGDHVDLVAVRERDDDVGVAAPARSSTSGCEALPTTVRTSSRSWSSRSTSGFLSTTVTSLASSRARLKAAVLPTWPAPRMSIFIAAKPCAPLQGYMLRRRAPRSGRYSPLHAQRGRHGEAQRGPRWYVVTQVPTVRREREALAEGPSRDRRERRS